MNISSTAVFLVNNICKNKVTYLQVIEKRPELKEQIDAYIEMKGLKIDKTV